MPSTPHRPDGLLRAAAKPVRGFFGGVALLFRGFAMWTRSPRLMLLGALPPLIVGAVYVALIVVLLVNIGTIAAWTTPFADSWYPGWRFTTRLIVGIAIVVLSALLMVVTFAAVTLAVGDPFYERIQREVENRLGDAPPEPAEGLWSSIVHGVGNGLRLILLAAAIAILVFAIGLIPVAGPVCALVIGAVFGGWVLALELTGFAFDARGMRLRDRRRLLARQRAATLGFGVTAYVLFLIPFAAVVVMPVAVTSATLLARHAIHAESEDSRPARSVLPTRQRQSAAQEPPRD